MLALAVLAALTAAALFGGSSVLMAHAARAVPEDETLRLGLLARLTRSRTWLIGAALQPVSFCVQALALALGPLALVQPVAATDLLFALPFQAHLISRRAMRGIEWVGGALVAGGVAGFLAISPPRPGVKVPTLASWVLVVAAIGGVVTLAVAGALRSAGTRRATLLAVAAGTTFALLDVSSKAAVDLLRAAGLGALLGSWYPYALLAIGATGLVLSQSAFQAGPVQASLPVIDTLEPTIAVGIGVLVFHETLATSVPALAGQLVAGAAAILGIVMLDRSAASGVE